MHCMVCVGGCSAESASGWARGEGNSGTPRLAPVRVQERHERTTGSVDEASSVTLVDAEAERDFVEWPSRTVAEQVRLAIQQGQTTERGKERPEVYRLWDARFRFHGGKEQASVRAELGLK
jgi:hypothetical protein